MISEVSISGARYVASNLPPTIRRCIVIIGSISMISIDSNKKNIHHDNNMFAAIIVIIIIITIIMTQGHSPAQELGGGPGPAEEARHGAAYVYMHIICI